MAHACSRSDAEEESGAQGAPPEGQGDVHALPPRSTSRSAAPAYFWLQLSAVAISIFSRTATAKSPFAGSFSTIVDYTESVDGESECRGQWRE